MKLHELHEQTVMIEEGKMQRAIAAASLVLSALAPTTGHTPQLSSDVMAQLGNQQGADTDQLADNVVQLISAKYKVNPTTVEQIVAAAKKYEHPVFPRAQDILAVVGVESSFNPAAVSNLWRDPAKGLMQVRPGVWKLPKDALNTVDGQIKHGAQILRQYYEKLGSKEEALHAYNVGLTNHRRSETNPSKGNPRYVPKVQTSLKDLTSSNRE